MKVFVLAQNACEFVEVCRKLPKKSTAVYVSDAKGVQAIERGYPIVTGPFWDCSDRRKEIKAELKLRKLTARDIKGNVTFDPTWK